MPFFIRSNALDSSNNSNSSSSMALDNNSSSNNSHNSKQRHKTVIRVSWREPLFPRTASCKCLLVGQVHNNALSWFVKLLEVLGSS